MTKWPLVTSQELNKAGRKGDKPVKNGVKLFERIFVRSSNRQKAENNDIKCDLPQAECADSSMMAQVILEDNMNNVKTSNVQADHEHHPNS